LLIGSNILLRIMQINNLQMVLWDIMVGDWKARMTPEKIAQIIEKKVFDGAIICLHDSGDKYGGAKDAPFNTIDALKIIIPKLKQEEYEFVTVEEFYKKE
jgi:peptidoglycan-N-acetylglucosamine deacetylase